MSRAAVERARAKSAALRSPAVSKSSKAASSTKKAAPAAKSTGAKRKRDEEEDDDDADFDLDAMIDDDDDDDDNDDDDDDGDELDIDPQEIAAMQQLYGRKAAAAQDDDDDNEDDEQDGGEESSDDDGAEYGDDGTGGIARPAKKKAKITFLNNKAALEDKLNDIRLPISWPWVETLTLTTNKSFAQATGDQPDAVHDDLKREAAFYELSLGAATEGLARLTDLRIPFRIPPDFFAERVKPDKHMNRIKDKLLEERAKMNAVSERKTLKEARKFAKEVQSSKIQAKAAEKKANTIDAGKMRKQGSEQELGVERSILPGIADHIAANRAEDAKRREKKNFKREAKDKKFGHGGKKRHSKSNSRESAGSSKDFSLDKMRKSFSGFSDAKPGSFSDRRSSSNKGPTNRNGSSFGGRGDSRGGSSGGRGGGRGGSSFRGGGRGGGRGGKPNRPGKSSRAQSRK